MWEDLSVNHFLKHSNQLETNTKNVLKWNRALWLLFNIQSSDYGATTVAIISLYYFTFARSTISFSYV